ncbi:unnamed protein product, partial [Didymodactylos carnosus]
TIETPEYEHFMIGCDRSPLSGQEYCAHHIHTSHSQQTNLVEEDDDDYILLRNGKRSMPYHKLSCNTKKSKPEAYISTCYRTFGIIIYVFNCNVLLAVHEIMRSKTVKEILAGLCDIIRISSKNTDTPQSGEMADSWLPKTIVYDDCCHVVKHIIDYYPNFFRQTPASAFLYHSSFAIDAYHYRNHTDTWCRHSIQMRIKSLNSLAHNQSNNRILDKMKSKKAVSKTQSGGIRTRRQQQLNQYNNSLEQDKSSSSENKDHHFEDMSSANMVDFNLQQGNDIDIESQKSYSTPTHVELIQNNITPSGQHQLITNEKNYVHTEAVPIYTSQNSEFVQLPPITEFQKPMISQEQNPGKSIKTVLEQSAMPIEESNNQQQMSITSNELTYNQLIKLSQAHMCMTYDLRTNHEALDHQENLELDRTSSLDTDNQNIDLLDGGETTPQEAILHQKENSISNDNNTLIDLHLKFFKHYLQDNSINNDSRCPTAHKHTENI